MNYYGTGQQSEQSAQSAQSRSQQQVQQPTQSHNYQNYPETNSRNAASSINQYQSAQGASVAERDTSAAYSYQYGRTAAGLHDTQTSGYSNRSNYDTSASGSLSYTNQVGVSTPDTAYSSYHAARQPVHIATTQFNSLPQTTSQPARPRSVNPTSAPSRSSTSGITQTHAQVHAQTQSQAVHQPRYGSHSDQRVRSPLPNQWTPHNQATQAVTSRPANYVSGSGSGSGTAQASAPAPAYTPHRNSETAVPVTVNPTQVYDPYLEYQRQQAQRAESEATKRRATESEAAKRATEEAEAEEARRAEAERIAAIVPQTSAVPVANLLASPVPETSEPVKKKRVRKSGGTTKPKARKGDAGADVDDPAQAAALTLMQTANAGDLEAEMKEMFRKMREFNAKDPAMLSKLWQQERDDHLSKETTQTTAAPPKAKTTTQQTPAVQHTSPTSSLPSKSLGSISANMTTKRQPSTSQPSATPRPPTAAFTSTSTMPAPATATPTATATSTRSGTVWPADKKQALAAAASRLLQAMPANQGKSITPTEISGFLDTNPSYIELCKLIEARNFKVDVAAFAKALLGAVPGVTKTAQKPLSSTTEQSIPITSTAPVVVGGDAIPSDTSTTTASLKNAANRLLNGGNVLETETPVRGSSTKSPGRQRASTGTSGVKQVPAMGAAADPQLEGLDAVKQFVDGSWQNIPYTGQISKPTKTSRKTQSRPSLPAAVPATKEDFARKTTFADLVDINLISSDDEEAPPAKRHAGEDAVTHLPTPPETVPAMTSPIAAIPQPVAAIPRPEVDMQHGISRVTFPQQQRPGIAPVWTTPAAVRPAQPFIMVNQLDKYKAIRRSEYNPKTIARDVLLACGRHPDMRHLNAHLEALKSVFSQIDNTADLGTFRWDIADPGGPAPGSGALTSSILDEVDVSEDADDEDDDEGGSLGHARVQHIISADGASHAITTGGRSAMGPMAKALPRRKPRSSDPGIRTHTEARRLPGRPRRSEGGPSNTLTPSGGTPGPINGYAALRAIQDEGTGGEPIKKKGRPVGWRKWMMKGGDPGAGTPRPKASGSAKATPIAKPEPEPIYEVYKCEWQDCGAELHNLATLRRHIHKLHGRSYNNVYTCLWNDCGKAKSVTENGRTVARIEPEQFSGIEPWKKHMEKKHIDPIAWKLGDGPAGGLSDHHDSDLSDAYMSDSRGRRVTPTVVIPSPAARALASSAARPSTQAERDARELERLAAKRKRDMGPGIDRGGARLVNDKRRQGFMDDDDTAEVIDEED